MRYWLTLLLAGVVLIVVPLAIDHTISARLARYDVLTLQYECNPPRCAADFDGDGISGILSIDSQAAPPAESYSAWQRWLVVVDSGNELLRIPFRYADGSLRTHAGIRPAEGGSRLIIFDHDADGTPVRQVFGWNGRNIVQVTPTHDDLQILSALAAHDDAGTAMQWALYRSVKIPALLLYCILLLSIGAYILFRKRTAKAHSTQEAF